MLSLYYATILDILVKNVRYPFSSALFHDNMCLRRKVCVKIQKKPIKWRY